MPKDSASRQKFENADWQDTSTNAGAGDVRIAGIASGISTGLPIEFGAAGRAVHYNTVLTNTDWTTIISAPGATTSTELRLYQMGNSGTTDTSVQVRWAAESFFISQVLASGFGFNQNMIGAYDTAINKVLEIKCTTKSKVSVTVWARTY